MSLYHKYVLQLDEKVFGVLLSQYPVLHDPMSQYDDATWSNFKISKCETESLTWVMKRKLTQVSSGLMSAMGITWESQDFIILPTGDAVINVEQVQANSTMLAQYASGLASCGINPTENYKMPERPNSWDAELGSTDAETLQTFHDMIAMREQSSLTRDHIAHLSTIFCGTYTAKSIYPAEDHCVFGMMKFISYFRMLLVSFRKLPSVIKAFDWDASLFPDLIEAFTLKYIPSFTQCHNAREQLGDSMLASLVTLEVIKGMTRDKNYFINKGINMAVSNQLFRAIGESYGFQECVIGPIDVPKVIADCFEAICGSVYLHDGFDQMRAFFQRRLYSVEMSKLADMSMLKVVETLKMEGRGNVVYTPGTLFCPAHATKFIEGMNNPPDEAFASKSNLQIRCKMIGAALLKSAITNEVFNRMRSTDDLAMVHSAAEKTKVDEIAQKLGFPIGKMLKIFIGGVCLTNGFVETLNMVMAQIIPAFELFPKRRRRRHHTQANEPIPEQM